MKLDRRGGAVLGCMGLAFVAPQPAHAIEDGMPAQTCAFAPVVRLSGSRSKTNCSASYIGGKVLITAAHCIDNLGYQLDHDVIRVRTGVDVEPCEQDDDCPVVTIAGEPRKLQCQEEWGQIPVEPGECYLPDFEYNNDHLDAWFGESYETYGVLHPGDLVPIRYCHVNPGWVDELDNSSEDFAYCILQEEPDVEPIPIMMPCEIDRFLDGRLELDVMVAGFGLGGGEPDVQDDKPGRKRWAVSTTDSFQIASTDPKVSFAHFSEFLPGVPSDGDSGGPLYVRLPDDTWRVLGVLVKPLLASAPWRFVEWMAEDPEVEIAKILPCHDLGGDWAPGPACGGFSRSPQVGAGGWSYGPMACHGEDVGGASSTCGPPDDDTPLPAPGPGPVAVQPAVQPAGPAPSAVGCAVITPGRSRVGALALGLLGLLLGARRRRRGGVATLLVLLTLMTGCKGDEVPANTGGAGDTGGAEALEPLVLNPNFLGVHSGIVLPGASYDQLAVGSVSRPIGDPTCCQDVVVGGPATTDVAVFFGGGSTERGLTFLEPRPTQHYTMAGPGDGIRDLALVDLDGDGYNDLVVVSSGGELGVRLGQDGGGEDVYFGPLTLVDAGADDLGRMALGQMDCDEDLDVVVAVPGARGVVALLQVGAGAFAPGEFTATAPVEGQDVAGRPVDVAIGDFDGEGAAEIVSGNDDGTVTIYRREGCEGALASDASLAVYGHIGEECQGELTCITDTQDMQIETDDVFCGTPNDDLVVAFADRVKVYCNDGEIDQKIASKDVDHYWDFNDSGKPSLSHVQDVLWWPSPAALYVLTRGQLLRLADPGTILVDADTPKVARFTSSVAISEIVIAPHADVPGPGWWQRLTWVGAGADHAAIGFAR